MNNKHSKAIKVRRVSLIRLEKNPPADMTPDQVQREIVSLNAQITRIQGEAKND